MASFDTTRSQYAQEHFEVLEIDLPVIEGVCTLGGSLGFGTPLYCDQQTSSDKFLTSAGETFKTSGGDTFYIQRAGDTYTTRTYKFTNANAPLLAESEIYRCINSISETVTELKPSEGLSSRGTLNIKLNDFIGDPNQDTAAVTNDVKAMGSFFGKLNARQVVVNKEVRVKLYRVESDGTIDLVNGAQTRYYSAEALTNNGKGTWTLKCKDELSVANIDDKTWLEDNAGFLINDITDAQTNLVVDTNTTYTNGDIILIGDEFMTITNVAGTAVTVSRGVDIVAPVSGVTLSKVEVDDHSGGDEIFICRMSDNETIDSVLTAILTDSDVPLARIPTADWSAEVSTWHANSKINTLWYKAEKVNDVLKRILTAYLMDMWFDPTLRLIKLSAISVWKETTIELAEGSEINSESVRISPRDEMRASRALAIYNKPYLARTDDIENYSRGSQFSDSSLITDILFGKHKDKLFDPSSLLNKTGADLLVQRYVSRFKFTPKVYSWVTPERKLNFNTGDIVGITTSETQGANGEPSSNERGQILSIKPKYTSHGREYNIKAMTYEPAFSDNEILPISGNPNNINLYGQAGAPSGAVTVTFIFDNATVWSDDANVPAIVAGGFAAGSKIIIILRNGSDLQSKGGDGGHNDNDGVNGGIVYDAQGVETDIYLAGTDPQSGTASGFIRAAGGGGAGGANYFFDFGFDYIFFPGGGGGGGAGRSIGLGGGSFGTLNDAGGVNGDTLGNGGAGGVTEGDTLLGTDGAAGGDWGLAGANSLASTTNPGRTGGLAGKGIVKGSGGIVRLFGDTPTNFINGGGDTPTP